MDTFIISDIHFSRTKDLNCIIDPMNEFIEVIKQHTGSKRIIFGGDYFDHVFNNGDSEYKVALGYLKTIFSIGDEVIVLYGTQSHDRSNYDPIIPFLPSNVHFCNKAEVFVSEKSGEKILLLPEEYPVDFAEYYKEFFGVGDAKFDLVIGHGNIIGAKMNEYVSIDNNKLGSKAFNKEDLSRVGKEVFFGHIHLRQNLLHNVQYIGSMNKTGFGEEDETKGYWFVNSVDGVKEFRELKSVHEFVDVRLVDYNDEVEGSEESRNHYRILIDDSTSVADMELIKNKGLKTKRTDVSAREAQRLRNKSKLKYENMDAKSSIKEQFEVALSADKKNNKKIKAMVEDELVNILFRDANNVAGANK